MVIGLFIITAIPTVTGICQAVSAQRNHDQRQKDERRMKKFNIDVEYSGDNPNARKISDGRLVVQNERIWIGPAAVEEEGSYGYVCECIIVEYPDSERVPVPLGLVSQVQRNPPLLNWIYVDKDTKELRYGNKTTSIAHHVGTWDWTADEQFLTFEESYGDQGEDFVAVENQENGKWQLFYNYDGDALQTVIPNGWLRFPVRLRRTLLPESLASLDR